MYDFLEGEVAQRSAARLVLVVGGVGYELSIPIGSRFPNAGRTRAWTHLVVREDAHLLCGFSERETRELFRILIQVKGVGPVAGLSILSGIEREPLLAAIAEGDVAALTRIKGVGPKTAGQIVLDMKEKALKLRATTAAPGDPGLLQPAPRGDALLEDAVAALLSIGYSEKEARKSVERAAAKGSKKDLESLLRAALAG
ncbi:MAG: Holliday junction branch migration protein RuvA [Planctomycetes bacterium]|nr:Holliday junction branch migration protein RuvA [Planctomycetota bacterium]